ncbi:hypothetical protein [Streptomyces sp. GS7]|uniref:hypothetical protein n=1 Tax=Streptomyces sp. GS7 TaxID=2692234 RepID=UPI001316FF46|nr:hypothetical protein [Streptomyces sp. GS7]QHC23228.1 hypothetical protein GR130_19270 [Streptomyces sp. GS7]
MALRPGDSRLARLVCWERAPSWRRTGAHSHVRRWLRKREDRPCSRPARAADLLAVYNGQPPEELFCDRCDVPDWYAG